MAYRPEIGAALTRVAREINTPRSLPATLSTLVETATRSLAGIDHAGITISSRDGRLETVASTDAFVRELDELQLKLGEGPAIDALRVQPITKIEHADSEQRWPRFMPRAVDKGLRSQLVLRLYTEEETLGGLNLYSTSVDTIDPDVQHMAELLAAHASIALGRARREEDLNIALRTRKVIGAAVGILMERYDMDEDRAFTYLVRVSSESNVKLRDVAKEIVEQRNDRSRKLA